MSTQLLRPHTKWPVAAVLGIAGSLVVMIVVLAFLWPTKAMTAQHVSVGIVGSASAVTAAESAMDAQAPGTFDFIEASDRDAAVAAIEARQTYGAIILGDGATLPEVLTAPAAGASATQMLNGIATRLQLQLTQQLAAAGGDTSAKVTVTAVVPLAESDPAGTGLMAASFPLTMGGMIGGILISLLVVGAMRRLVALAGFGVAAGLLLTLVLQTWFGFLQGDFFINAMAMGLSVLATAAFIVGCTSLLGSKGIPIGSILTMLIGNPLASAATPWQFLPAPWGAIGQGFVPGAASSLIRSLSYFPSANVAPQWWVLIGWTALGVILALTGHFRARATMHVPPATLEKPETTAGESPEVGRVLV